MNDQLTLSTNQGFLRLFSANKRGYLIGLLAVCVPFLIVAEIGAALGTDLSAASAVVIYLGYLLAIGIATVVLKAQGHSWRALGLARPESWPKTIALALGLFLALVVALLAIKSIWINIPGLALPPSDQSDYNPLTGNLPLFLTMVVASFTVIAFGEEMVFRAFLINSLAGVFGNLKARWALALVGSSLLFALAHYDWGLTGVIEMFLAALIIGAVYLRSGRNLWVVIIAHGLIDTLKFSLIYAGLV
jgi:membrane protease YdiL (CAAX protease family)